MMSSPRYPQTQTPSIIIIPNTLNAEQVSGKQVIDANKYALQVLDEVASKHAGLKNVERPIIGVRGKRKDLGRIVDVLQKKRKEQGEDEGR